LTRITLINVNLNIGGKNHILEYNTQGMKKLIFPLLIFSAILSFCTNKNSGVRAKALRPKSDTDLVTGCYYITEEPNKLKRKLQGKEEFYFIEADPIVQVGNFKEVTLSDKGGISLDVSLDQAGTIAWASATEKSLGKKLAFIIDNVLVMAPTVQGRMDGGAFTITGNFTKEELEGYYKKINSEMYVQSP
jgi:hypothetical protein